ncbi:MAG: VUT family protein, partial [Myxococcota bacterium]|nr:VUT family protein [Myxococcota bacterium]
MATDERSPALPQASLISSSFPRAERAYVALAAIFVSVLVLTNIVGVKLFVAFPGWLPEGLFGAPLTLTTGILTYPITFLVTDVVSELWGRKRADFMVVLGFLASMGMLAVVQLAVVLPGSPAWVNSALGM